MVSQSADAGIERRTDIKIPAGEDTMVGWLYSSQKYTASKPGPAIVLAHGLGATKELKLDVFASKFNELGYTALVFDYRCNGASTGLPRGLIDWNMQQKDWHTALAWVREQPNVDPEQVGIFGTSFGGGHVIQVGATDHRLKAVISQCPFTHGMKSAMCCGLSALPRIYYLGVKDRLFGSDENPVRVQLIGKPGEAALMNAGDVVDGFFPLLPLDMHEYYFKNPAVPARLAATLPFITPGSYAKKIQCPVIFGICGKDSVAPAKTTLAYAKQAPKGVIKYYDELGHFDIYLGEPHEMAWKDYSAFIQEHLPV